MTSHRRTISIATSSLALLLMLTPSLAFAQSASPSMPNDVSPAPAASGLGGTAWHALNVGPMPTEMQLEQTIEFGLDGTLTVGTGCATYTGTYQAGEGSLELELRQVLGSATDCSYSDQGLADLFRNILRSVESWSVDENGHLDIVPNADYAGWLVSFEPMAAAGAVEETTAPSPGSV
jgi:META domain